MRAGLLTFKVPAMPKVSALLPIYNTDPAHLREAIDSVLAQTFTDFELLILDDCSTNEAPREVVSSYVDSRIIFMRNEKNLGIAGSRNKLIELSQGEYLAVIDHDDISLPKRFELQAAFLDEHPEVGVLGAALEKFPRRRVLSLPLHNDGIEELLMYQSAVEHPVSMIRKSVLTGPGLQYEAEFSPAEDYRLWTRLLGKTRFANLPDILLRYRSHHKNTTHTIPQTMHLRVDLTACLARREHPEIWVRAQRNMIFETRYKLFGAVPFMRARERENRKKYYLFGFLPLFTSKRNKKK